MAHGLNADRDELGSFARRQQRLGQGTGLGEQGERLGDELLR
jgi:hypothetical protein